MHTELFLVLVSISTALSLTCYICGDTNLDELGECSTQFQYDCSTYASRFPPNERIYCRTKRNGGKNNTFTIMKECISEQDHYRTFPEKGYRLDEECDLVNVNGEEVAYCLCRSDYCNRNPIADQFMAFEEKHPELFGDIEETKTTPTPSKQSFRNVEPPLKIQSIPSSVPSASVPFPKSNPSFAAPILNPPAIVPVNDLRSQQQPKSSEVIEIRRAQLPTRTSIETEIASGAARESSEMLIPPVMNLPKNAISEGTFVGSGPISPVNSIPRRNEQHVTSANNNRTMRCIQCGDGNLMSEHDECKRQVQVDCPSDHSLCFTRQINLGNGMFGLEKMCVLPDQLVNEFGQSARFEGCGSSNGGKVQYCACASPLCNQMPLEQQKTIFKSIEPSRSRNVPELSAPDLPVPSPPAFPDLFTTTTIPIPTTTITEMPPTPRPSPIAPIIGGGQSNNLKCLSCSESDMVDPTADCSAISEQLCDSTAKYCVTKQTQISTSSFAMEKRCLSDREAAVFLPGEKVEIGCATSESGMVNYCICAGKLCNRQSLLQQAQMTGVRDSLEEQRILEEEIRNQQRFSNSVQSSNNIGSTLNENKKKLPPPVFLDEDDSLEVAKDIRTEEDIISERQREWANANINSSPGYFIFFSIILPLFIIF